MSVVPPAILDRLTTACGGPVSDDAGLADALATMTEQVAAVPTVDASRDRTFVALQHLQCEIEAVLAAAEHHRKVVTEAAIPPGPADGE